VNWLKLNGFLLTNISNYKIIFLAWALPY